MYIVGLRWLALASNLQKRNEVIWCKQTACIDSPISQLYMINASQDELAFHKFWTEHFSIAPIFILSFVYLLNSTISIEIIHDKKSNSPLKIQTGNKL
jgi:hypothetical protein